jgi:hypothetical protein
VRESWQWQAISKNEQIASFVKPMRTDIAHAMRRSAAD